MSSSIPSVPHMAAAAHHASMASEDGTIDPQFFGTDAPLKPTLSLTATIPSATPSTPSNNSPTIKIPIPAKSQYASSSAMVAAQTTPSIVPWNMNGNESSDKGIFGWGVPAEITFFVCLAFLGFCLPLVLFLYLRRRRRQAKKAAVDEVTNASSIDLESTLYSPSNGTTRPPTASSWLEMLKHRTETPAPPHANNEEIYYEPPKQISFARRKFYSRRSGRLSEAEIEREVRELDEEVRRRSKATRSRGQSVGVLPDFEDPCSQCAQAYTHDERGHTQPIEGRKATPVPFLAEHEKPTPVANEDQADSVEVEQGKSDENATEPEKEENEAKDNTESREDALGVKVDA
ncbi:hypothetical protein Dda_5142 [Drechslerella dactyloides]|uniref:Uncharacterized protein n=1 Tax=Drechslerella dactyloides TaxID=74499 RepID=A0AAD6IVI9_DREDA|nr:hypothetical protein Dda_5142 [Drechslerella dactyloides]